MISDFSRASTLNQHTLSAALDDTSDASAIWSQRLLHQVEATSRIGTWVWNLDTETIQWSAQMFRIFGLEVAQQPPTLQEMSRFFSVEGWQLTQEHIAKARETGQSYYLEVRFQPHASAWGWMRVHAEVMDRSDGTHGFLVGTCQDITQDRRLTKELEQSHTALRRMVLQVDRAQEEERRRIARDLHDDLQQNLAAIHMMAWQIEEYSTRAGLPAQALSKQLSKLVDATQDSVRRIVKDLRPHAIDQVGLLGALDMLANEFASQTQLRGQFRLASESEPSQDRETDPDIAICLYRIAQEGLNNIRKHAKASWFDIELYLGAGGQVALKISDDGRGITDNKALSSSAEGSIGVRERVRILGVTSQTGLISMRERVGILGGTLQLAARQPHGLELLVRLPNRYVPTMP